MADVEEINRHIEIFEDTKKRKVLFFNVKRKESDYWQQLIERLKKSQELSLETRERYLGYMDSFLEEYSNQRSYFEIKDRRELYRRIIKSRINLIVDTIDNFCSLGVDQEHVVHVEYIGELQFKIFMNFIHEEVANIISWLITSEYNIEQREDKRYYTWISSKPDDTSEKVFRIFDEVIEITENKKLLDFTLI